MNELDQMLGRLPSPNRERCLRLWSDNSDRFNEACGSSHNHQAWVGGYLDHITDVMQIAETIYAPLASLRSLPFSASDACLVLFLHDLEKPWKSERDLKDKAKKRAFRASKIAEYGITLSPEQENALLYVEGEGDDYRSDRRVMNELAAFCHMCDVASARIWHSV